MSEKLIERELMRSSEKCFLALELINTLGPIKISDLCTKLEVPRTTAVRIANTLVDLGYITRDSQKRYAVSIGVNRLSSGLQVSETVYKKIESILTAAAKNFMWPLIFLRPEPDAMYTAVTTDELTPYKIFPNPVGTQVAYHGSASGTVFLAFCGDDERTAISRMIADRGLGLDVSAKEVDNAIKIAKKQGFYIESQWRFGNDRSRELYSRDGVIAVPLCMQGKAFGVLAARFIDSAVEHSEIESSILPEMQQIGKKIEFEWNSFFAKN